MPSRSGSADCAARPRFDPRIASAMSRAAASAAGAAASTVRPRPNSAVTPSGTIRSTWPPGRSRACPVAPKSRSRTCSPSRARRPPRNAWSRSGRRTARRSPVRGRARDAAAVGHVAVLRRAAGANRPERAGELERAGEVDDGAGTDAGERLGFGRGRSRDGVSGFRHAHATDRVAAASAADRSKRKAGPAARRAQGEAARHRCRDAAVADLVDPVVPCHLDWQRQDNGNQGAQQHEAAGSRALAAAQHAVHDRRRRPVLLSGGGPRGPAGGCRRARAWCGRRRRGARGRHRKQGRERREPWLRAFAPGVEMEPRMDAETAVSRINRRRADWRTAPSGHGTFGMRVVVALAAAGVQAGAERMRREQERDRETEVEPGCIEGPHPQGAPARQTARPGAGRTRRAGRLVSAGGNRQKASKGCGPAPRRQGRRGGGRGSGAGRRRRRTARPRDRGQPLFPEPTDTPGLAVHATSRRLPDRRSILRQVATPVERPLPADGVCRLSRGDTSC